MSSQFHTRPLSRNEVNDYINKYHRHHKAPVGYKFAIGAERDKTLVGIVVVGRPVARNINASEVVEVTRLCTIGERNACSFLYAKAARIAREMGYKKIISYILETEEGTSLKAAGWKYEGLTNGGSWNTKTRPREDKAPICKKQKWSKTL